MVDLTIDGKHISVEEGTTILKAAEQLGISIPTLCYLEDINEMGACRVCVVEVEGQDRLEAACNTPCRQDMVVLTHSKRAEAARKINLEVIDSHHNRECDVCVRDGFCELQDLFEQYNIRENVFSKLTVRGKRAYWDENAIIQKDFNKCILCGRCIEICKKVQGAGVWDFIGSGTCSLIGVPNLLDMDQAGCIACGQCITHCPDAALTVRDDTHKLLDAINDPNTTCVVQIAPAVRSAWAATHKVADGDLTVERMVAALHKLGVDYVFDTVFSADLTIMEEGTELIQTLTANNTSHLPMFTSCCPGWVAHVRKNHPELLSHVSTAKSPMMMFGAVTKTWFAQKINVKPENIFSCAIMPCTAKKNELEMMDAQSNPGIDDVDCSLTTREFVRLVDNANIDVLGLEDEPLDNPLDAGTGAGVIFGTTGGVMEAALRSAHFLISGTNPDPHGFVFHQSAQGPWREGVFEIGDIKLRCAVVDGLAHADKLIEALENKDVDFDFIEVMACPGGCAGGGGQPIVCSSQEMSAQRGQVLRDLDDDSYKLRFSHENPGVAKLYETWLGSPCSKTSERYLHINQVEQGKA